MNNRTKMKSGKIGSVMVVGAGIGGIQAALDLAESGFYVYLIEKSPSIGGRMAQLDKTFPTNDCSMCIMGPKLVECGRHLNIEILTLSNIEDVKGEEGNFQVRVHQKARYIDADKCTGCGDCATVCPVSIPDLFNEKLSERQAIYLDYPQSVPRVFAIEKRDRPPCNLACPAHINVQGYVAMVKAGKYREAVELIMRDMPLPGVLGRVCVRFCEEQCRRREVDEAVSINQLKRFAADQVDIFSLPLPEITAREEKVAIIGAGPSGLAAGYFLGLQGYQSTIFEALDLPGGMLAVGIPEYRLPRDILNKEIENIKRYGVEIRTNTPIGKDVTIDSLFAQGCKAVYIATGAHQGMRLNIPGEEQYDNVYQCAPWLKDVNTGRITEINGKVVVLGGGNAAIDAARVSIRLGAGEVHLVYRRGREEIPADPLEIEDAMEEGVHLHTLASPEKIIGDNAIVKGVECIKNSLGKPDESGRRRPIPIEGSQFIIEADLIIAAIGQRADRSFAAKTDMGFSAGGLLSVNPDTLETKKRGVFAGGDVVTGPKTVIEAIAQGKQAAKSILCYLQGRAMSPPSEESDFSNNYKPINPSEPRMPRAKIPSLDVEQRVKGFDESNLALDEKTARKEASRCLDCGVCSECFQCVNACQAYAIDHDMADKEFDITVGSILLAPGFNPYDPSRNDTYGYNRFPNVVTSLEFERLLSASGPYGGHLIRPFDKKAPKKIAWLQCVGSRNVNAGGKGYCSAVCCTYAIKQAIIAKEHSSGPLDAAIFYIDIRTYGKDFERYYNRARDEIGIRFIKSRINTVFPGDDPGSLTIRYTDEEGNTVHEDFDMVVLSVGLETAPESIEIARSIGIDLTPYNFVDSSSFDPVKTSRSGVYACGVFEEPKDIPDTVAQASAAAAAATFDLAVVRGTRIKKKTYPPERDVRKEPLRIGVFICHCGINIGGIADVKAILAYARSLPGVVYAEENLFTCSEDTQAKMKQVIMEQQLNRVVVASCTPRTHGPLFMETCREAGLNPYLFDMANIRDQCTWVHMNEPEKAKEKAKDLVRMTVARAAKLEPLYQIPQSICQEAMVVGGGVSGMAAAVGLADQGFKTVLIERESMLGGNAQRLQSTWKNEEVAPYVQKMIRAVHEHNLIEVHLETTVKETRGIVGRFSSRLINSQGKETEVNHGVAIIANGADSYKPKEYLYGEDANILLSLDLDQEIVKNPERIQEVKTAVFIQCVGSREPERPYCSKVCCTHSIRSAITLKKVNPAMDVFIIYRDIRTYGEREDLYREARSVGIHFIRYEIESKPVVEKMDGRLRVTVFDQVLKRKVQIDTDMITLASAVIPREDNKVFAEQFKVALNQDGFFMEAHAKLRPVDFASAGIFVCGLAHGPKAIDESISQAQASVSRGCTILSHRERMVGGIVAEVDPKRCVACLTCVRVCPFHVPRIDYKNSVAIIDPAICQGCGICTTLCPNNAIQVSHYKDEQMIPKLTALY
jgi:heterodisulfide reductase subunit A-like polyferredoxin